MWIFSEVGFFSVVEDHLDWRYVWVRARWKKDLVKLRSFVRKKKAGCVIGKIYETPGRDYPFRVHLKKGRWALALFSIGNEINYGNFKGAIQDVDPEREQVYMRVWSVMKDAANPSKGNEPWEGGEL